MLAYDPQQVMNPNQAILGENQMSEVHLNVPDLPFSQARRNEIFSETSSRVYRELRGPESVVLQQNNFYNRSYRNPTVTGCVCRLCCPNDIDRAAIQHQCDCSGNSMIEGRNDEDEIDVETGIHPYR